MQKKQILCWAVMAAIAVTGCKNASTGEKSTELASFNTDFVDSTARPQDDFYQFANGLWIKDHPVPASESRYGSFNEVQDRNNEVLKKLLEEASAKSDHPKGSASQLVGDYYQVIMDSAKREADGIKPIQAELDRVNAVTPQTLTELVAWQHSHGMSPLFSFSVQEDLKDNTKYSVYIGQTGFGLPDKEYYFKKDPKSVETRAKYQEHLTKMFSLAGITDPAAAKAVFDLETRLSEASMNNEEQRNIQAQYNKYSYADFKKLTPSFDWDKFFAGIGVGKIDTLVVSQPKYMKRLEEVLKTAKPADLKYYYTWEVLNASAGRLNSAMEQQNFAFYSQYMNGTKEMKERWKRAVDAMEFTMGDALGKAFVEKAFSEDAKKRVNEMVDNLQASLKERLEKLDWMSDSTRKQALEKMASFGRKMAYPDKWRDMSKLAIARNSYAENAMNAAKFYFDIQVNKLGKPIDKNEWLMPAHLVNAYYNPVQNEICFPAGILQPPFFDPAAEDAVNYARMGAVIGHEMIHGFDDQGAQFDAKGLFRMWWTPEDNAKFQEKTKLLANQYSQFMPINGDSTVKVNGNLTLGENIADFGGLTVAYYAYQKSLEGKKKETIHGYTPEQRFFIAFAQIWKSNSTDEALRTQVATDPHSPAKYRVNGTLANMPEFFQAFNIKEGDKMRQSASTITRIW
jgi:putative endopeptidase